MVSMTPWGHDSTVSMTPLSVNNIAESDSAVSMTQRRMLHIQILKPYSKKTLAIEKKVQMGSKHK